MMFQKSFGLLGILWGPLLGSGKMNGALAFSSSRLQQHCGLQASSSCKGLFSTSNVVSTTDDGVYIVSSMPDPLPDNLKNDYYLLRHGQSWGNVEAVISSARSLATSEKHGLTPLGYEQGKASSNDFMDLLLSSDNDDKTEDDSENNKKKKKRILFYSSPFARARQTASACIDGFTENNELLEKLDQIGLTLEKEVILEDGLMERFFGELDDAEIHTYGYVWPVDMKDVTHTEYNVESVAAVSTRISETILKIDAIHQDDIIVLVSHADVLQITQLYAAGAENVGTFSSYRFTNGEVRKMARTVDSLPEPQPLEPPSPGT